ncbi:hypothetical protein Desgi_3435 [Desulfoscipio gibsoniae DSM 7213]|uniref:Uncharacterized protein n=1 Tax=Desulfoscipio gibsoniae DSM 7213 TaxID=767817 RepID=R4KHT7_9FIRM|nr:hypothetical protein Desgi_3435 [Desulfoscipio gibsoniae DSM 7213]
MLYQKLPATFMVVVKEEAINAGIKKETGLLKVRTPVQIFT